MTGAALLSVFAGSEVRGAQTSPSPRTSRGEPAAARAPQASRVTFEANRGQTDPAVAFVARARGHVAFVSADAIVFSLREATDPAAPAPRRNSDRKPVATHTVRMEFDGARAAGIAGASPRVTRSHYFRGNDPAKWVTGVPHFGEVGVDDLYDGIDLVWRGDGGAIEYEFRVEAGADPSRIAMSFRGADSAEIDAAGDLVLRVPGGTLRQTRPVAWQDEDGVRRSVDAGFSFRADGRVAIALGAYDRERPLVIDPVVHYTTLFGGNASDQPYALAVGADGSTYIAGSTTSTDYPSSGGAQPMPGGGFSDGYIAKFDPDGADLLWVSYLSGNDQDFATSVAVDGTGRACVTGYTQSGDFPTVNAHDSTLAGTNDAFLARLAPDGASFVYSTYIGGGNQENNHPPSGGVTADATGNATVVVSTGPDFAEQLLVERFDPTGANVTFAITLGGSGQDTCDAIALGPGGTIYVAGRTNTGDNPVVNGFQTQFGGQYDLWIVKLDPSLQPGSQVVWSTFLGGTFGDEPRAIAVDSAGAAYVTGVTYATNFPTTPGCLQPAHGQGNSDAFVSKIAPDGASLVYSTYLGGSDEEQGYGAYTGGIAVDAAGVAYVVGTTRSTSGFPIVNAGQDFNAGFHDAFFVRLNASGSAVVHSTYIGGQHFETSVGVGLDGSGNVYVAGFTTLGLPTTAGAYQTDPSSGGDAWIVKNPRSGTPVPPPPPPPTTVASYFLPKTVRFVPNARDPAKSVLNAAGIFDTGPGSPDFTAAATLDIGGASFDIPALEPRGRAFVYEGQGIAFTIVPGRLGSSRAKFKLRSVGAATSGVSSVGPLEVRFRSADLDATCDVTLVRGLFGLGRVRGSLDEPNLHVQRATAIVKGDGKDALLLLVGLATDGLTPDAPQDLTVRFGGLDVTVPAGDFERKGSTDVFRGDADGVTSVIVDYARERIVVTGRKLSLGSFEQGGNSASFTVVLGGASRTVRVRLGLRGSVMKY